MLGRVLLGASRSQWLRSALEKAPVSRGVVARFIAGYTAADAVRVTRELINNNLTVTIDHLGEDTLDRAQADAVTTEYLGLLTALKDHGLTDRAEVSVKLTAVGQALPGHGEKIALENAQQICQAAADAGTTVTLDMEDHTTTDSTLSILQDLRDSAGAVVMGRTSFDKNEGDGGWGDGGPSGAKPRWPSDQTRGPTVRVAPA